MDWDRILTEVIMRTVPRLFTVNRDLPVCTTKEYRNVKVHPLPNGDLHITPLRAGPLLPRDRT